MIRDAIADLVRSAAIAAQQAGEIPAVSLPDVHVFHPQRSENGDYSTNLPMQLGKALGKSRSGIEIAESIARHVAMGNALDKVVPAPPGFINFFLDDAWLRRQVDEIIAAGDGFGNSALGNGATVQVEFVSANPTGPIHVGNGRGAVTGGTLAALLEASGYAVEREYYVNDAGGQAETFGRTLYARYQQAFGRDVAIPDDGYPGEYMVELAQAIRTECGDQFLRSEPEAAPPELRDLGIELMLRAIRSDLELVGVRYDRWFSERALFAPEGGYERTMALLRAKGHVVEKEGAVWFSAPELGQDRDNVLVRSGGAPTYFASDIAYHRDKFFERGFDQVIDIWGADHQGHVARLKTAVDALGVDPKRLTIILYQLVTLRRGPEIVRLSKRAGDIITLREVVEEVGVDACRFFFLMRSPDSAMDFDLELAKEQSNDNPVYYVQYAHARIAGILRKAAEESVGYGGGDVGLLAHPAELDLIRRMLLLPEEIEAAARRLEVHALPHYALQLAQDFHAFYTECRVVTEDSALTAARLKLVRSAQIVLANVLRLMGMNAPERM